MGRRAEPWKRASKGGAWYAQVNGKQVRLADGVATKTEAKKILDRLWADRGNKGDARTIRNVGGMTVAELIELFGRNMVGRVERDEISKKCAKGYSEYLKSAERHFGAAVAEGLGLPRIQEWLDAHPKALKTVTSNATGWGPTTRNHALTVLGLVYSWGVRFGHVRENPLKLMPKPRPEKRTEVITPAEAEIFASGIACQAFRDLVTALRETGCRPGEIYTLTADRVDLEAGTWRVHNKTRRKTGEKYRTVYLSDAALELSRRLAGENASGTVFRNGKGKAWTSQAVDRRFRVRRKALKLPDSCIPYAFRHLYVTDCLEKGIPPLTIAELVGHADLKMIMAVYSKLRHRTEHLAEAARKARAA